MRDQKKALGDMIRYAYNHTRYYRRVFDRIHIDPNTDEIDEFYSCIPVTTKSDYYNNKNDFISDEYDISDLEVIKTSGSTGSILGAYWDKFDRVKSSVDMWRARREYGINSQSRVCYFHTILKTFVGDGESVITSPIVYMPSTNTLTFSKMKFDDSTLKFYYEKMIGFEPEWILCYPTTMFLFTEFMKRYDLPAPKSIKYLELMGEVALPLHVRTIKEYFGSNVAVRTLYGMQETNGIAVECNDGYLHILSNNVMVEIEKGGTVNRYADNGKIIVTSLINKAMPFIRYQTGDWGSLRPSDSVYNKNDILVINNGRVNELIRRENASPLECGVFFYIVEYVNNIYSDCIKQFRIIQKGYHEFEAILNIENVDQMRDIENIFIRKAAEYGITGAWKFNYVDSIMPEKNGKLRYFISQLI